MQILNKNAVLIFIGLLLVVNFLAVVSAQQIATFTGASVPGAAPRTTDAFYIPTSQWTIEWSYTADPKYAFFAVFVFPKGETALYTDHFVGANASLTDKMSGVEKIYQGKGEYYLKIVSANIDSYALNVVQGQADSSPSLSPSNPSPTIPEFPQTIILLIVAAIFLIGTVGFVAYRRRNSST
jgi:hypothetical protein